MDRTKDPIRKRRILVGHRGAWGQGEMRGAMAVPRKVHSNGRDWSGRKCGRKSRTAKNLQVRAGVLEYRSGHDRGDAELSRNSGSYRNPRQANEMLQKATDEAKELLQQSEQLAMEQTRLELIDSAITDEASGAAREAANMQRGHRAAEEVGGSASDKLAAFIAEQGVWHTRAHALACTLTEQNSPYASIDTLDAKLRLLRRALPGVDVPQLAARDAAVLSLPADSAVSRLLELTDVFSFNKLHKILLEVPSLLYLQDFKVHARIVLRCFNSNAQAFCWFAAFILRKFTSTSHVSAG